MIVSEETVQSLNQELLKSKQNEEKHMQNHGQTIRNLEEIVSPKYMIISSLYTFKAIPFTTQEDILSRVVSNTHTITHITISKAYIIDHCLHLLLLGY